jgi:hypothetical protein
VIIVEGNKRINQEIPVGSHLAMFFSGQENLREMLRPIFDGEIEKNRKIVYIRNASDTAWLKSCISDYDAEKHDKFIKAWTATDISLRRNGFTPIILLDLYKSETAKAQEEGFKGLTIMLEVTTVLMQLFLEPRFARFFMDLQNTLAMTTDRFIFEYDISRLDNRVSHMIMSEHPCFVYQPYLLTKTGESCDAFHRSDQRIEES